MSKEQFDHIENRIREAAENSEPPFNDQAWANMEAKLNNEKEDKRRFFIWWFFAPFLFIAIGIGGYFSYTQNQRSTVLAKEKIVLKNSINTKQTPSIISTAKQPVSIDSFFGKNNLISNADNKIDTKTSSKNKIVLRAAVNQSSFKKEIKINEAGLTQTTTLLNKLHSKSHLPYKKISNKVAKPQTGNYNEALANEELQANNLVKNTDTISDTSKVLDRQVTVLKKDSVKKDTLAATTKSKDKKQNKSSNNTSRFYVLGSIGADAASVHFLSFKNNTIAPKYGGGIGYQLNKKFSIQTGFYVSDKKYVAGPKDYTAKAGSYMSMVQIIKVDAACLVYEIPLAIRYNILQKKGYSLYATTGLSSLIMKKEDYDYYYNRNNMYHESAWTYTGNKNLFSMLTFSAGIEKKLSKQFSITAEPSVSLPISGVGDGRVKLFSTALQIGVKYQPLKRGHKN